MKIQIPLKVTAGAYLTGQCVGGILSLPGVTRSKDKPAAIIGYTLVDRAKNAVSYDLFLFSSQPAGTVTDNATFNGDPVDDLKTVGCLQMTGFVARGSGPNVATGLNIYLPIDGAGDALWGVLVIRGGATYAATTDLILTLYTDTGPV
jgi:hypothetical protein